MARFNANEIDKYKTYENTFNFFSIPDDKGVKRVRIMYSDVDDIAAYAVHRIKIGDRDRYVSCLRKYDDPMSDCPLCADGNRQVVRLFIPIYDIETGNVCFWERGSKFYSRLSGLCARFPNLVSHVFEIERHGAKGDTSTQYEFYEISKDETTLNDLPEIPDIIGSYIFDKSADEMEYYLDNGQFPYNNISTNSDEDNEEEPVRRRQESAERIQRRTPANNVQRNNRGRGF